MEEITPIATFYGQVCFSLIAGIFIMMGIVIVASVIRFIIISREEINHAINTSKKNKSRIRK